jgi:GH25 family lysozyme M1 (1,4-beta-N-acetylmuramidase)
VTGSISFGPDCASYQGDVDWMAVSAVCRFGAEKVTEGTGYVNPRWESSKKAMAAVAERTRFVPVAYLFLDAMEPGAAQARFFAEHAGDLAGFGIAVDDERALNGDPTPAEARAAVAELHKLYPRHPVGGYAPHWFTGTEDLSYYDWLWASSYVAGSGDPGVLYGAVPASWWAPYGDKAPALLQFTDSATIAGISGQVDCSAFHGDAARFGRLVLPRATTRPVPPPAAPARGDDPMLIPLAPGAVPVSVPIWADAASYKEPQDAGNVSLVVAGDTGAVIQVALYHAGGTTENFTSTPVTGQDYPVVPKDGWATVRVARLRRLDGKQALGASAVLSRW